MTDDYYELLGVPPDASREEIRAAYRDQVEGLEQAERARLNRAWNVLSDPIQRDRYDERRAAAAAGLDTDDEDALPELTDEQRAAGSGKTGARTAKASPRERGERPPPRPRPDPTIVLPDGMEFATPRARGLALAFDVAVVLLILLVCQQFVPRLVDDSYERNTDRYQEALDRADEAQKREDRANDRRDEAERDLRRANRQDDEQAAAEARAEIDDARAAARKADNERKREEDLAEKIQRDELAGPLQVATGVAFVLALIYTVPSSALTGQTIGKRLRKIKLVRVDGSKVGWLASFAHYGFPIAIALLLSGFLGPLAGVAGLAIVLWYLRDRNYQGVHDKLAKTVVVELPPSGS
jgi:curved DNA-binding protein CbpA